MLLQGLQIEYISVCTPLAVGPYYKQAVSIMAAHNHYVGTSIKPTAPPSL